MVNYDPGPPLSTNPHQISLEEDPGAPSMRRAAIRAGVAFFGLVLVSRGVVRLAFEPGARRSWAAYVVLAIGLATLAPGAWKVWVGVRRLYRFRTDRCVHCGYSTDGSAGSVCPECGRDPFLNR